ncbi:MAG: glycosyltransferase family 2 protein [Xanthomonadales bacterium]|nr:glycosyltransferase family 2 protein [Xanthomonadales bacterium]
MQIIVPVFDAFEHLQLCLDSIARTVPADTGILLIDDASTDQRIRPFLRSWADENSSFRQFLGNDQNMGFVATANRGLRVAHTDVVLLNSDTRVSTGWLENLAACLASDATIATATPWSNNGEIVSIPEFCRNNPPPADADAVAMAIKACGQPVYPELPTAVGFCMAISARAIERVGLFDEATFGRGYGEENDFCQRAKQAGFRNVLCDDAYVVHHGGASFGPLGLQPDAQSMQRLLAKHPHYQADVTEFIQSDPLAGRRREILDYLEYVKITLS